MLYKNFSKRISDYGFPKVEKNYTELSYVISKNFKKNHEQVCLLLFFFNFYISNQIFFL